MLEYHNNTLPVHIARRVVLQIVMPITIRSLKLATECPWLRQMITELKERQRWKDAEIAAKDVEIARLRAVGYNTKAD